MSMTIKLRLSFALFLPLFLLSTIYGCMSATEHAKRVHDAKTEGDQLSVGKVQREIRTGMSGAEVIEVLGSPNIVSTDEERREVWVYDKISTDRVVSQDSGGATILILGVGRSAGASSTSQKTLTIIIKFDKSKKVRDFAYHTSRF